MKNIHILIGILIIAIVILSGCKKLNEIDKTKLGKITGDVVGGSGKGSKTAGEKTQTTEKRKQDEQKDENTAECGDGSCNGDETCSSCEQDCGCEENQVCTEDECKDIECSNDRDCPEGGSCDEPKCKFAGTEYATCTYEEISKCRSGDGCCPSGCSYTNDDDCDAPVEVQKTNGGGGSGETVQTCTLKPACNDGIDNDNDTYIDYPNDPQCFSANDNSEAPFCGNGICEGPAENSSNCGGPGGDCAMVISTLPPSCTDNATCINLSYDYCNLTTNMCANIPLCRNGRDDDGDGLADYPADPECQSADDWTERAECGNIVCEAGETYWSCPDDCYAECSDCKDNDGDGLIDYPADPECLDYLGYEMGM